jgi:hypothetical protein
MNWRAHVKHRLALGHHRLRTMARIMTANGIKRKLARKVGSAVAMFTAVYGIEAMWEGQMWLLDGFHRLSVAIGREVAGTFSTAKGEDAIRAGDVPPTRPALDRRRTAPSGSTGRTGRHAKETHPGRRMIQADIASHGGSPRQATTTGSLRKADRSRPVHHGYGLGPRG